MLHEQYTGFRLQFRNINNAYTLIFYLVTKVSYLNVVKSIFSICMSSLELRVQTLYFTPGLDCRGQSLQLKVN